MATWLDNIAGPPRLEQEPTEEAVTHAKSCLTLFDPVRPVPNMPFSLLQPSKEHSLSTQNLELDMKGAVAV